MTTRALDVMCIASGPSLTVEDCEIVRQSGIKVIAVNNSWKMAPWCNYLYAGDMKWWRAYGKEVNIEAEKWTCSRQASNVYKLKLHVVPGGYNSGMRALQFAVKKGFKSIGLLGYDCSLKHGTHWHGPHNKTDFLRNPCESKIPKWKIQFNKIAKKIEGVGISVVNCSRYTEIKCFPRVSLEEALQRV